MDQIKTLAKVGIGLAVIDFIVRGFGPLYTNQASQAMSSEHFIGSAIIPFIAIIASFGLIKAKKIGLYIAVFFTLLSLFASTSILRGGTFTILPILYLIIYGILTVLGFKTIKALK